MGPISTGFAVAVSLCLAVCLLAAHFRHRAHQLFGASAFIFTMFWLSRAVSTALDPPWSMAHYPPQDALMIWLLWFTRGRPIEVWRVAVMFLLLLQLGFHSWHWTMHVIGWADLALLRSYILLNNLAFAVILLVLTAQGVGHVLAGLGSRGARGLPGLSRGGGVGEHSRLVR